MAKITISGLRASKPSNTKNEDRRDGKDATIIFESDVPPGWLSLAPNQIASRLRELGYAVPSKLEVDMASPKVRVVSADTASCYDARADEGLCIREDESFASWWTEVNGGHKQSKVTHTLDSVSVYGTTVAFVRTLRVPDSSKESRLPPGMGRFPLVPVACHEKKLPEEVTSRGGYIIPMYQREALWLKFEHSSDACNAIKVSVGGINALTGAPKNEPGKAGVQDYLVKTQPWLDGIVKEEGKVKQFVAMPVGQGYTVEEQLTGKNTEATLQLDVFPAYRRDVEFRANGQIVKDLLSTPLEAGFKLEDDITVRTRTSNGDCTVRELLKLHKSIILKAVYVDRPPRKAAGYSRAESCRKGEDRQPVPMCRSIPQSQSPAQSRGEEDYLQQLGLGISAGGSITQQINKDSQDPKIYDFDAGKRIYIHFINAGAWKNVTGSSAPITPVDKEAYKEHSIPWFSLYDEPEPAKNLGAGFSTIKSVNEIDAEDDAAIVERVEGPEEGESKDNDSDEALFGGRWKEGNDGTVIDIDASKLSTIRRVGTLLSGSIRRPSRWNRSCVAPGNSDHVHPTKPVPNSWTFESDNVSRLTR